ncbi:methyl-accepting chemotaxis protein [Pseudoflavonifractor sp. 524-17]|uniref:methyl-accepting chemotaxis protein n=1 Tax=Pseudoflavonifractor sp. 524-17 TaxID=2304577 RepID=UPI00137A3B92|nr:methyl-accepting chemotaxis protein [Pseudoflavonifractor sp. 524-17]NCE64818.1 methyl-accepting chemotaxis protein [Pseudoflavonifractor sp. 524-17]
MRFIESKKLATRIGVITSVITLIGMTLLWLVVSTNAASMVKNDITNQMTDAVESRAAIINEYVLSAEEYMSAFALGSEVRDLLLNPDDPELLAQAQSYTEDFAAVKGVFEGLYIATPATHVLTHTSQSAIGMTTRSGDSLKTFQDTILSRRELTNLGIMKSPGTGSMILSMYCPIFEGQQCIGYVGAGVYASHLMDSLLNLDIKGLPNSEYVFLNVDTGVYLYHEDDALLNTKTTDAAYLEIIQRIGADGSTQANTYSYRDENGIRQLVVYKYLKDRGWVFMVRDNAAEVYAAVTTVRILVGVLCAAMAAAVILITLLILRREGRDLMAVERAIDRLGELNLSADQELEPFYGRSDEIGMIAQTTHRVCSCLRKTIDDVGRILGEMANGNLTVDVTANESYYIGDFKALSASLQSIHANLVRVIRDISQVAGQVDASAERVSSGAQALAQGTTEQAASVEGLMTNVTAITEQIQTNTVRCGSASELVGRANGYAVETDTKMEQLTAATRNINQSSAQISTIIKTIEDIAFQTNILALNAAVEAARAGSAGKGFSVVADEVRSLAAKSTEAAQNTNALISQSVQNAKSGTESTDQAVSAMRVINDCIQSIKSLMDEIASASVQQSEMISLVESGIKGISAVVQDNSMAAEKSASVSKELSQQARTLNSLISRFRIR